jgi:hypothetical protein
MKHFTSAAVGFLASLVVGFVSPIDAVESEPELNSADVMALIGGSFAKIRVFGAPDQQVVLAVIGKDEKEMTPPRTLQLGPSGTGDLCVCAMNSQGLTGKQKRATLTFIWNTPPFSEKGRIQFDKFWNFRKGSTLTDGYSEESFRGSRITWKIQDDPVCEITRIWWSKKRILPKDAEGNVKKVGALVLRKR